jgi:integrase/recombinase XerC
MDSGADIQSVKALLGHSNLAATQVYMHNSAERLKKIYQQAHPKSKRKPQ